MLGNNILCLRFDQITEALTYERLNHYHLYPDTKQLYKKIFIRAGSASEQEIEYICEWEWN